MPRHIDRSQCTLLQLCREVDDGYSFAHELIGATASNFLTPPAAPQFAELKEHALELLH